MEFTINCSVFSKALERAQGIVDKRNTIPLLSNVLIEAVEDGIQLTASDMEIAITGLYEAQVKSQGEVTLSARQLYDIVKRLPQDNVNLKRLENDWVEIRAGKAYFKLVGLSADGYPTIPELETVSRFQFSAKALKDMIDHTLFSIATDDSRYNLNGALLEKLSEDEGGGLRMISTDGHRLSMVDYAFEGDIGTKTSYLFPRKGLSELRKLCNELGDVPLDISVSDNAALFQFETTRFFMRLLEGDFPDYRQVIPSGGSRTVYFNLSDLKKALQRVSLLSSEKTHSVRFNIGSDEVEISASSADLGESREVIPAEVIGDPLIIGFNAKYFLDALSVISDEDVILELGDSLSPGVLRPKGNTHMTFVIMPMRLD